MRLSRMKVLPGASAGAIIDIPRAMVPLDSTFTGTGEGGTNECFCVVISTCYFER